MFEQSDPKPADTGTTATAHGTQATASAPRRSMRMRRIVEFGATLVVGASILAATLYFVDFNAVLGGLRRVGYAAAALAGVMALTQVVICAYRWQLIARETGGPLRLQDTLLGYLEATFVNAFLPTLIASDGVRVLRAINSGASAMNSFVGVITDRIVALCGLAFAAASGVIFLPGATDNPVLVLAIVGILPAFIVGIIGLDIIGRVFVPLSHWRIVRPFLELASYVRRLRQMPRLTAQVVAISVVGHMSCAAAFFILASQLGIDVGYWAMFALSAPILVYAAVPISIGGWGVREAVTAALFGLVGVAPAMGVALSIAFGLLMSVVGIFCGGLALLITLRRRTPALGRQATP
ncbi:MAG: YbhN family protein [Pseudorhodoplanes sp.]|nr:YbhN family protein [Pseudorhodoplanes sp.]